MSRRQRLQCLFAAAPLDSSEHHFNGLQTFYTNDEITEELIPNNYHYVSAPFYDCVFWKGFNVEDLLPAALDALSTKCLALLNKYAEHVAYIKLSNHLAKHGEIQRTYWLRENERHKGRSLAAR